MEERKIGRRDVLKGLLWAGGVVGGAGSLIIPEARAHEIDLEGEDYYHRFVNQQALQCANECEETPLAHSLAFDTSDPLKYKLFIPEIATAGRPNVPDGWHSEVIPMLAAGEVPPPKPKRPEWNDSELSFPIFKGPSDKPLVALTVDDGNFNREEILKTILEKDVSASFLTTGAIIDQYPDFIRKAEATGKITWANHTYDHILLAGKTESYVQDQLKRTEAALKRVCGATTLPMWRPPGGGVDSTPISAAKKLGFRSILWNVSGDAGLQWSSYDPTALANYYIGLIDRQSNPWGSIILMHFRESTAVSKVNGVQSAIAQVIDGVRARGMEPVSLDKLLEKRAA